MTEQERYTSVAYDLARRLTLRYSSSFGLASKLFKRQLRPHIYAVYGMVRLADEIVDTYHGDDVASQLDAFQRAVHSATTSGYSTNPILHAFGQTVRRYDIPNSVIDPFFDSMRRDITATTFTRDEYERYIYGSAEVVGLLCLYVFCEGDTERYATLSPGARALGRAYQKINFLRDVASDYEERGRMYFPGVMYETFDDAQKQTVEQDILHDLEPVRAAIKMLPGAARTSVYVSYVYYMALFKRLRAMSAEQLKHTRAHVPTVVKLGLLLVAPIGLRLR